MGERRKNYRGRLLDAFLLHLGASALTLMVLMQYLVTRGVEKHA